ncbi:MAG: hypothetical protein ACAH95_16665 [Fimbriimonas sp.]
MRWFTLALAAMMLIGCGSKQAAPGMVTRKSSGPTVDVSVEPLRVGGNAPKPEAGRAQQIAPAPADTQIGDQEPPVQVKPRTFSSIPDEEKPKPRRKRKRIRRQEEDVNAPGDTQIDASPRPERRRKKEKNFEDLSEEERRRLIEGG